MTRASTLVPMLLVAAGLVLACGADPSPAPTKVEPPKQDAGAPVAETPGAAEAAKDGVPTIASDAATFDFGAIKPKDSVEHVFAIRNAGTADLKIERVQRT